MALRNVDYLVLSDTANELSPVNRIHYAQIDTIRGITICFIVWGHCLLGWENFVPGNTLDSVLKLAVFQTGKIGTVIFFLVAGFLLRTKLREYTFINYCKARLPRVYIPWLSFMLLFLLLGVFQILPLADIWVHRDFRLLTRDVYNLIVGVLLYTAYWFVTTYIVSMLLLVSMRKYAEHIWLGAALGSITLFYGVNYYYQWIPANHGKAILAYAFFVWLGIQLHKYYPLVQATVERIPWIIVCTAFILFFILCCVEANYLSGIGCADPFGSNRISNSILSLIFFAGLLKMGRSVRINKLKPRKTVFGVFLMHVVVIFELSILVKHYFSVRLLNNVWKLLAFQFVFLAATMLITYGLVRLIERTNYRWLLGLSGNGAQGRTEF